jgi:outer membrane lipoprotein-sorting protein
MKKIVLASLVVTSTLMALTNLEVANRADKVTDGFESSVSKMEMTLVNASGQKSVRDMLMKTLEGKDGDKTISIFLSPADVKGTKVLGWEHVDRDDDQWLYLPALKRVKRIASRNKSGSFMGSEFSYEDIGNQNPKKYIFNGEPEIVKLDGLECYKGERIPKDKYSGYTKQITWVDTKDFLIRKIDYYDRKKELLKTATFSEYKKIDGIWRVGKIVMVNHQNDKKTILIWKDDKIKAGLSDRDFDKRELKK